MDGNLKLIKLKIMWRKETKGNLVKKHKGVNIYITSEGMFFCDCNNNSDLYENKTFNSEKLQSLEKAIDSFEGNKLNEDYYLLSVYPISVKKFTAKSKVGDRIIFNDGTDSNSYQKRGIKKGILITNKKEFEEFLILEKEDIKLLNKNKDLEKQRILIREKANILLKTL